MNGRISKTNKLTLLIGLFVIIVFSGGLFLFNITKINAYNPITDVNSLIMPICVTYTVNTVHSGYYAIDFSNSSSPPVFAAGPGKVLSINYMQSCANIPAGCGYGHYVQIEHTLSGGEKIKTLYAHLASVSVSVGQEVDINTQVGIMGKSGNGGNGIIHLHFEIYRGGSTIDPSFITQNGRTGDCAPSNPIPTIDPNDSGSPTDTNDPTDPSITDPLQDPNNPLKSYYLNTPTNWNMDSCEKVVRSGPQSDIITGWAKVSRCNSVSQSADNESIPCTKRWVVAFAETVSIDQFPLLGLLSSSEPTESNQVRPACYYNVTKNITKDVLAEDKYGNIIPNQYEEQLMNFTKDYMGLLNLSSSSKSVNIGYPKLGTAVSCTTLNWDDNLYSPKFDIQLYNRTLPDVQSTKVPPSSGSGDAWWTKIIDWIKNAFQWLKSLEDYENENIMPVSKYLTGRDSVCTCSATDKIKYVNESDVVLPVAGAKKVVVNENDEFKQWSNTQLCDYYYKKDTSENVEGVVSCKMTGIINAKIGTDLVKGGPGDSILDVYKDGAFVFEPIFDIFGIQIGRKCLYGNFCGQNLSCGTSVASMYSTCRGSLSVLEGPTDVQGDPTNELTEPGFDKLTIPGMNKALYNTQIAIEQINSSFDIQYGLNLGVRLPSTRIVYDLNSKQIAYTPDKIKGKELDPSAVKTSLKYFISYKKTDYNYRFLDTWDAFTHVGDTVLADYYFPYIGKMPYLLERISVISSNENEPKTAASLLYKPLPNELIYDPQIVYCSELTDEEKLTQDCYTTNICGDLMTNYLEKNSLSFFNCTGANPNGPAAPNPPIPSGPPGPTEPPGGGPIITITPGPIPQGPFNCAVINSEAEAETFIATVVAKYPGKLKTVGFTFSGSSGYCDAYGTEIRCDASFKGASFMTNRLVFHELMHFSRSGIISGGVANPTSELQASMMESIVVSGNCYGGAYSFIGKDNGSRLARAVTSDLLNIGGMSEEQMWDFALGKSDTITPIISNVISGGTKFYDLYCKDYGVGDPVQWYGSPMQCSSGSGDSGSNNTNLASVLAVSTVGNPSANYCAANTIGTPTTPYTANGLNCLIKRVADSLNSGGERISAELIWAFTKVESGHNCTKVAGNWIVAATTYLACTGDANQIAYPNPNGSGNILGFTQITNSTYPQAINYDNAGLLKCFSDLGVVVQGEAIDTGLQGYADTSIYTRKTIGASLCAGSMLYTKYGTESNGGTNITIDEWNIQKKGVNAAVTRYYGADIDGYSAKVKMYMDDALQNNIFANCN